MTLIETAVVLAIIAVLLAILTPILTNYVDQARIARAQSDVRTIGEAIARFEKDLGRYPMFSSGTGLLPDSSADVIRLQGPGGTTSDSSGGTSNWATGTVDDLLDQLVTNSPGYTTAGSLARPFKWKGPYVDIAPDPWGQRYLVNIINAKSSSAFACFVISAGPNGKIDTPFDISAKSSVTPSGDDILYRIR